MKLRAKPRLQAQAKRRAASQQGNPPMSSPPRASAKASGLGQQALQVLEIEKVVAGGRGLARSDQGVVLVSGALPGEQVEASVTAGKGVREGVTRRVLRAHPQRVAGLELPTADLTYAAYPLQLQLKRELVQDTLGRIGRSELRVEETVPSPQQWHYRNGAQYLITPRGFAYRSRQSQSPWLLPPQGDPLVLPAMNAVLEQLAGNLSLLAPARELALRASEYSGEVVATLIGEGEPRQYLRAADTLLAAQLPGGRQVVGVSLAQPAGVRFSAGVRLIAGEPTVTERLGDVLLSLSASGFAQVNSAAAGAAYQAIARLAVVGVEGAPLSLLTDLYGGSGAIGRHLLGQAQQIEVIDTSAEALKRGQSDVQRFGTGQAGAGQLRFIKGDASGLSPHSEVIVVDPPRAGLSEQARAAITHSQARRLVYLSCDPATWARDVAALQAAGWGLEQATPYDFYPQTSHVEVLSVFARS